jgi:hypothetical protein
MVFVTKSLSEVGQLSRHYEYREAGASLYALRSRNFVSRNKLVLKNE